jgi:hypothetical protein
VTASGGSLRAPVTRQVTVGSDNVRLDFNPPPYTTATAAAFLSHSAEYYQNVVTAAYQRYLGRAPGPAETTGWVTAMQHGLSDEQLEAGFIGAAEYIASHGGQGAGWVSGMYHDLLGRTPTQAEVDGWVSVLNNGVAPQQVAYGFAASVEREGQRINADYVAYLGRSATQAETSAWVNAFEQGTSNEDVVAGFVGSAEYFNSRGQGSNAGWIAAAYHDILGRAPSTNEVNLWLGLLG